SATNQPPGPEAFFDVSRKLLRRSSDLAERLVEEIVATSPRTSALPDKRRVEVFLRQYFGNVPVEDMQGRGLAKLAQAAVSHLEFGATRAAGKALLRIYNPSPDEHGYASGFTIVEMVNDNMPFLVDSVAAAIDRQNLSIHMTIHPVLKVRRDARGRLLEVLPRGSTEGQSESFIRFEIDRETDAQLLKVLEHEI